ncbi:MAG TPA: FKBP-type peptidyl-prolyl cis-trans isomerase [Nitrospira sp.]|jgi:FKBP-type peptidyl-prolyl cis-trans isomerase 2|nr:FKBP-type peptidyl-prolyl cis-trans isomerase [Nitrospira sp.]
MPRSKMWFAAATLVGVLAPPLMLLVWAEGSPVVQEGAVVLMEFTITVPESQLVIPKNISQFTPGHHELLPNLEKALTGMKKGDEKRVDLPSDDAFGPYDETKKGVISTESLPPGTQPGTIFTTEEGVPFVVTELSGPVASIDFNHPLAGKHLIIDVKILNVESPTQEGMTMEDRPDITI